MIRQIITPRQNQHIIQFPDEMLGKQIEVIAFELPVKEAEPENTTLSEAFRKSFETVTFPTKNWKFNRDEANDYD